MFQPPEHNHNFSMWLSEVLHDIGVSETMVMKTRRTWMLWEVMKNTHQWLVDRKLTSYFFGSQSEATTTLGLNSDIDTLSYFQESQVIQDWSQWQPQMDQYLMVQDETVSPGYCLLQLLRQDVPLPRHDFQDEHLSTDSRGRVLLRHSLCLPYKEGATLHGPALSNFIPGSRDHDFVLGLHCPSWPKQAIPWLRQQNISGWPTEQMKRYSADQGCLVVPVGSKTGLYHDLEWRISTSLCERCLMYNLNITQIMCYILMKMILKTFLMPICGDAVSSFMCKNILFYCIAGSEVNTTWNEGSLLTRLNQCLQALLHCLLTQNCPHFVIPRNNLLAGKLSAEVKRHLADVICTITGNIEQSLFGIQIDTLGIRLCIKLSRTSTVYLRSEDKIAFIIAHQLIKKFELRLSFLTAHGNIIFLSDSLLDVIKALRSEIPQNGDANVQYLIHSVSKLGQLHRQGGNLEKVVVSLLIPFLCTTIGSVKASADIQHSQNISSDALKWFSLGLNLDVSSSKLKLSSALYCAGDLQSCEMILLNMSGQMSHTTLKSTCRCVGTHPKYLPVEYVRTNVTYNTQVYV